MTSMRIAFEDFVHGSCEGRKESLCRPRFARLRARIFAGALDRRLIDGESVQGRPLLSERARLLTTQRSRRAIAAGLERAIEKTEPGGGRRGVPVDRHAVSDARPGLETLVARLLDDGADVNPRGVALTRRLLTDGFGPLYGGGEDGRLVDALTEARRALDRR